MWRLILLLVLASPTVAPAAGPRLVVRGDDMGMSHAVNEAVIQCFQDGIETTVEVIVPSPWFPEAVRLLEENPSLDVGVHLALTSEWDNVKWRPLTGCPSLQDADGYFHPMIFPNRNYPSRSLLEQSWKLGEIEAEFRAQIETAQAHIPHLSHLSGHMHCTGMADNVAQLVKTLAKEYRLDTWPSDLGVVPVTYVGPRVTSEEKLAGFIGMLESLEEDKTYLFVNHPGLDTPEMRAIHHIGYADVAADRQGVTNTLTSPQVRALIRRRGIQLISYRDLAR